MDRAFLIDMGLLSEPAKVREEQATIPTPLQHLWFSLARRRWSALVFVPVHADCPVFPLISVLLHIGQQSAPKERLHVVDARRSSLSVVSGLSQTITTRVKNGERVMIAIDPVLENPAGMALLRQADAAVLCVTLDEVDLASARRTLGLCGKDHFVGAVALRHHGR